ncbi:MAG TPA: hypothetical protein VF045_00905 [Acidimicrobiales bacterium]
MTLLVAERPLDEVLARAAVALTLDPHTQPDSIVDRLLALSCGNRTAVERALRRVSERRLGRAATSLRLALDQGSWAW